MMTNSEPLSGYTLPVFACAAAVGALRYLRQDLTEEEVSLDLIEPPEKVVIAIEQIAKINENTALAITRSDPGDNLDLTRNTPVWALVELRRWEDKGDEGGEGDKGDGETERITIKGGEGIGRQVNNEGKAAIYRYAERLLKENLEPLLAPEEKIIVTIILPEGRKLAERTSNAAFGVLEGLSLLGTTGIAQPLSAPGQLEVYQEELKAKATQFDSLVFCVGENGLDLAQKLGVNREQLVKTANWLGSMLVAAGLEGVKSILLFGYHGKLIKIAGGIFHTHNTIADGRLETLTAYCARSGLPTPVLQEIFASPTTEAALDLLRKYDAQNRSNWVDRVYRAIAATIDRRSEDYIHKHSEKNVRVGCVLFDRQRQIIVKSATGVELLSKLC